MPEAEAGDETETAAEGDADETDPEGDAESGDEAAPAARSEATDELWQEVGVEPVKVALPGGQVGFTLRGYRPASQLTPTEAPPAEEDDADPFAERERVRAAEDAALAAELVAQADPDAPELTEEEPASEDFQDQEDESGEPAEPEDEEVPIFLSHRGRLLLFATPESLVSFIGSDAPHDLTQLDTWATVTKQVRAADVVPTDQDTYGLDLVVENLRGGHDAWDLPLLIGAGELARDVGWALRLEPVITALAAGSPLDDLDEALRATDAGGMGGLFARRRLRRIGAQQASLGWRTVIGKISAAVDWRD
ncbi:MAG: DNA primase [Micromonosporaceae bacterium]|nr:DNA primase [Micromonosporaceae bacterium]